MANTSVTGKYLILKTKAKVAGFGTGGTYLIAIDNIMTILAGGSLQIVYQGGLIITVTFVNKTGTATGIKADNETIITYLTNSVTRLMDSNNSTFEIPYAFPEATGSTGEQMYVNEITVCIVGAASAC
tara:strand:+ start:22026 stop:22409 length:384 start_codon:yes stop_codon:yes gene_type:complete